MYILSRASEVGSPTNPPWAPGNDKTRGQGYKTMCLPHGIVDKDNEITDVEGQSAGLTCRYVYIGYRSALPTLNPSVHLLTQGILGTPVLFPTWLHPLRTCWKSWFENWRNVHFKPNFLLWSVMGAKLNTGNNRVRKGARLACGARPS